MAFFYPRALRPPGANWAAIRDLEVRQTELEVEIDLRRLGEERAGLEARLKAVDAEIDRMKVWPADLEAHWRRALSWGWLFVLAAGISIAGAWWSSSWFLTLTWEKALLASTLFVLPLIGWVCLLTFLGGRVSDGDLGKVFVALGLAIVLCSATAVASLGAARMIGVALQEERYQASAHAEFSDAEIKARLDRLEKVKQFLGQLTMVAVVFLSIAGEAAAGIAYHEYRRHIIVVRTVRPFYAERARIVDALVENATLQEEARQRPEILHARLTAAALREEEAAQRAAEREERRSQSVVPTLKWVAIGFLGLLFALVLVSLAMAEEDIRCITAVAIDLSTSTSAGEFDANLRAVEQLILGLSSATRVAIFPVNEASFSSVPLFVSLSPSQPGRFREYQEVWQAGTIRAWRSVMGRLEPRAPGSDIIGTLGRVALEFEDFPKAEKRLMLLSDMRQVGRGFNFEQTVGDPKRALERASRDGLVPKLTGVKVWVLGVHTEGVNERRWNELKAFWSEYFRRAGAELHAFTPNRQVTGS